MKAVLLSLKPEWWEKIRAGEKDMEIRKTAPQGGAGEPEPWPVLVLVYVSGTGGVQGKFLCPGYVKTNLLAGLQRRACIPMGDLAAYAGGPGKSVCAWIVENPVKFDEPRPLAEFGLKHPPMSWQYIEIPETEE